MEKTDARKLKPEAQQQLRHQAIRLRKQGFKVQEIAKILAHIPRRSAAGGKLTSEAAPRRWPVGSEDANSAAVATWMLSKRDNFAR